MKKKVIAMLTCTALFLTGCSMSDSVTDTIKKAADKASSNTAETTEPTGTPAPETKKLALGQSGKVKDWKITVKKVSFPKHINNGSLQFKPHSGKTFVVVSMSAKNNGKQESTLFPRVGLKNKMVTATLIDKNNETYQPTQLLGYDKDIVTKSFKPQSGKKGIICFEVPKKAAKEKNNLQLKIGTVDSSLVYPIKK